MVPKSVVDIQIGTRVGVIVKAGCQAGLVLQPGSQVGWCVYRVGKQGRDKVGRDAWSYTELHGKALLARGCSWQHVGDACGSLRGYEARRFALPAWQEVQ